MATKNPETINLIDIFSEFKDFKRIDKQTFINVLEDSFRNVIAKMYGTDANYDVIINPDKGDLEIYRNRLVMEDDDVANPETQISLSEARETDPEIEVGEDFTDKVDMQSFGRRMILNLRQTLASKILELQKENLYLKYSEMMGQVVTGELYQVWKKEMLLLDEPLVALDAFTRMNMQDEILNIWSQRKQLALMVTHSIDEAVYMGTRVLVMEANPGRITADIKIDEPFPRDRSSDSFVKYRNEILNLLHFGGNKK